LTDQEQNNSEFCLFAYPIQLFGPTTSATFKTTPDYVARLDPDG